MPTIAETARKTVVFRTLSAAIRAADLDGVLSGPGPFTVFAPTNEAFDKVPQWALAQLFEPETKDQLLETVKHHIVRGRMMAADVRRLGLAKTLQGQNIRVDLTHGLKVDGAKILKADIVCDNGIIHIIDAVIPPL